MTATTTAPQRERRWIILAEDGRHVTVGRHTDPTDEELARSAHSLRTSGVGGWLAVTEGQYFSRGNLSVMMVRELVPARATWDAALDAFQARRRHANSPTKPKAQKLG